MKLNNNNYYSLKANKKYFSVSQVKDFMKCEAYAMAKIAGEWKEPPSTAMLIGSYVDSYFEGTLEEFKAATPEIFKKDGSLKSDYIKAEQIIQRVSADELFMLCMSGRKQVIMTGEICGAPFKIKMDSYITDEAIVDLKVVKKIREVFFKNGGRQSFIEKWGYDMQLAVYQEIVRQNTGKTLDSIIAAADKQDVPDFDCILIPNDQLTFQLGELQWKLPHIIKVKNGEEKPIRCGVCDYCKTTKVLQGLITPDKLIA